MFVIAMVLSFFLVAKGNYGSHIKQEMVLVIGRNCYHIHHWMWASLVLIVAIVAPRLSKVTRVVFAALLCGLILEGLVFKDWSSLEENCERAFTISRLSFTEAGYGKDGR